MYYVIIAYKQNVFYLLYNPVRFLFAPFYFIFYGLSLAYTRIHAALTITDDGWGTRGTGAKCRAERVTAKEQENSSRAPACAAEVTVCFGDPPGNVGHADATSFEVA